MQQQQGPYYQALGDQQQQQQPQQSILYGNNGGGGSNPSMQIPMYGGGMSTLFAGNNNDSNKQENNGNGSFQTAYRPPTSLQQQPINFNFPINTPSSIPPSNNINTHSSNNGANTSNNFPHRRPGSQDSSGSTPHHVNIPRQPSTTPSPSASSVGLRATPPGWDGSTTGITPAANQGPSPGMTASMGPPHLPYSSVGMPNMASPGTTASANPGSGNPMMTSSSTTPNTNNTHPNEGLQHRQSPSSQELPGPMGGAHVNRGPSHEQTELDKAQISLILQINSELLIISMNHSEPNQLSPEQWELHQECLKRLKSNLQYLASIADRVNKLQKSGASPGTAYPSPSILSPPPGVASLVEPYWQLQQLFQRRQ